METTLLYGQGQVAKRNFLLSQKSRFTPGSILSIDLKQQNIKQLEEALLSRSMFDQGPRLVIAESAASSLDIKNLSSDDQTSLIVVADNLETTSVLLKGAKEKNFKIVNFEGEKELSAFPFLDSLIEGRKQSFAELNVLLEEYDPVYVITMIYYLLRRNFLPSSSKSSFMQNKIDKQKSRFEAGDWRKLYKITLETDFAIKSGLIESKTALTLLVQNFIVLAG